MRKEGFVFWGGVVPSMVALWAAIILGSIKITHELAFDDKSKECVEEATNE